MKAYTQGEVDYFCGVYAVINACRRVLRGTKHLSYNDGCLFYQYLMQYLIDQGKISEVLRHGTDYELILRLAEQGSDYVFKTFGVKITLDRPYDKTSKSPEAVTDEIASFLKRGGTSCIIRLNNGDVGDHWSVIEEKTAGGKIKLFDSYAYGGFSVKKSVWLPEDLKLKQTDDNPTGVPKPPKGMTYLTKCGLILLTAGKREKAEW